MARYHRKSSRKKYFVLLFFIAITMGVGYAYLSSTLQIGGTTKVLKPTFANDSWQRIISNVKNGTTDYYHVGDTKEIDMGEFGTHTVRIANMSTPSECATEGFSQTACGFVVEFADIITNHVMNTSDTNENGWPNSSMRTYINNHIYNTLPNDLKSGIIDTYVVSGHSFIDNDNFSSSDKIYLLSSMEIWGFNPEGSDTSASRTRQLDFYNNVGVNETNFSSAIKQYNNSNHLWWLRSAYSDYSNFYNDVTTGGMWSKGGATILSGVSPAFRIG